MLRSSRSIHVLNITKVVYPKDISATSVNYQTFSALTTLVGKMTFIVQSPDHERLTRSFLNGAYTIHYVPRQRGSLRDRSYFIREAKKLALTIASQDPIDLVTTSDPFTGGRVARFLQERLRIPFLFEILGELLTLQVKSFSWLRNALTRRLTLQMAEQATAIRVVSQEIGSIARKKGIPGQKIYYLPTRCDTTVFDPRRYHEQRAAWHRQHNPQKKLVLLFLGRLSVHKGVPLIIDALATLPAATRNKLICVIAGMGEEYTALKKRVRERGLEQMITFLGEIPFPQVPATLAIGDIFVSPSFNEGLPRALLEAMAMELAPLVTRVGGNKEVIQHQRNGLLIPPGNVQALARSIDWLVEHKGRIRQLQKNARQTVIKEYSFKENIAQFANIIKQVSRG